MLTVSSSEKRRVRRQSVYNVMECTEIAKLEWPKGPGEALGGS